LGAFDSGLGVSTRWVVKTTHPQNGEIKYPTPTALRATVVQIGQQLHFEIEKRFGTLRMSGHAQWLQ
jgi:hypothetical protein